MLEHERGYLVALSTSNNLRMGFLAITSGVGNFLPLGSGCLSKGRGRSTAGQVTAVHRSSFADFLRKYWHGFRRSFFARPSLLALIPLLVIGMFAIGRAYWLRRETNRQLRYFEQIEQARQSSQRQWETLMRQKTEAAFRSLPEQGTAEVGVPDSMSHAGLPAPDGDAASPPVSNDPPADDAAGRGSP